MYQFLQHALGFCGESHMNLWHFLALVMVLGIVNALRLERKFK